MADVSTTLDVLLQQVVTRLVSQQVFTDTCCFLSLNPDQNLFQPGDQYGIVTPGPQRVVKNLVVGSAEWLLFWEGSFKVTLWSRLALDSVPRDDSYLTDLNYGAIGTMTAIINALHLFQPSVNGAPIMAMPIKADTVESYAREFKGVGWGAVKMSFNVWWQQTFSRTYPDLS